MEKHLLSFLDMSQHIGKQSCYVQGGGGNTSVKVNNNEMIIKASGYFLSDLNKNNAFTVLNHKKIKTYFDEVKKPTNDASKKVIHSYVDHRKSPSIVPSMESGFHAVLSQKYVIHTHNVFANVINCCVEATTFYAKLSSSQTIILSYFEPGAVLSKEVLKLTSKNPLASVIYLQNHGVICAHNAASSALELHKNIKTNIESLSINFPKFPESISEFPSEILNNFLNHSTIFNNILFPDQAIYLVEDKLEILPNGKFKLHAEKKEFQAIEETLRALLYIHWALKENGLTPNYIKNTQIKTLKSMSSEEHRRQIIL